MADYVPPVIYDASTDTKRVATQADIDRLEAIAFSYGLIVSSLERARVHHQDLLKQFEAAKK